MRTFRDVVREERTDEKIDYLASRLRVGDVEGAFVEAGELEQGAVDAQNHRQDSWGPLECHLRRLSRAAGAAYRAARRGDPRDEHLHCASAALAALGSTALPQRLMVRATEGYTHYGLDPVGYSEAARQFAADVGDRLACLAIVVGIRSVGTSLSAIVAEELGADASVTVRPRGAAGDRVIRSDAALDAALGGWLARGGDVVVVDEGPGATGETFGCVAGWLRRLGVQPERIVFFCSHPGAPSLGQTFGSTPFDPRIRRYAPPCARGRIEHVCSRLGLAAPEDLSAGRWREAVPAAADAPAIPWHERPKYRAKDTRGRRYLLRYAGLGRAGLEAGSRARRLAGLRLGPAVAGQMDGFLAFEWVDGRAAPSDGRASPAFLASLAGYLATRSQLFRTGERVDVEPLLEMLMENATDALGEDPVGLGDVVARVRALPWREAVLPDGRLQSWEWIDSPSGFVKTDSIDHGDGIRYPGPTEPAWDIAAATVEYRLSPGVAAELVDRCAAGPSGEGNQLTEAVHAYRSLYAAAQLGEAALAVRECGDRPELRRLQCQEARYKRLLREGLALAAGAFG